MAAKTVVTIARQYGSGGREIGLRLAEKMGVKCYDKELLDRAAKDSGICQELFEHHDEKPTNSFLYSLVMDTYSFGSPVALPHPIFEKLNPKALSYRSIALYLQNLLETQADEKEPTRILAYRYCVLIVRRI